jgi:hypothetical protein
MKSADKKANGTTVSGGQRGTK